MRSIARNFGWALFMVMANLALAALAIRWRWSTWSTLQLTAVLATGAALLWSLLVMVLGWSRWQRPEPSGPTSAPDESGGSDHVRCLLTASQAAALLAGVVAGVILVYLLVIRGVYFTLEILHGAPLPQTATLEFSAGGLLLIAALIVACLAGLRGTGRPLARRMNPAAGMLVAALFWLLVLAVFWATLLLPLYQGAGEGAFVRTSVVLVSIVGLSLVVSGFVVAEAVHRRRVRWQAVRNDPDALLTEHEHWPGIRKSAGAMGILLVLLICFQTTAPPDAGPIGGTLSALITAVCAGSAGAAVFTLVGRRWSPNLADTAMGLVTLAVAAFAVVFVPSQPVELGARFPMVFNAFMFALAVMSWFWVWIARVWRQQIDGGQAWTAAGRLAPLAESFAFFVACLALIVGSLMAVWPRLRPIATTDDSLGRVAAAVAAHLLLMLALLWNGRTVGRSSFSALTILAVLSLVGFIVVRARPLSSSVVHGALVQRHTLPGYNVAHT